MHNSYCTMHKGLVAELAEATITVVGRFGMLNDRR